MRPNDEIVQMCCGNISRHDFTAGLEETAGNKMENALHF